VFAVPLLPVGRVNGSPGASPGSRLTAWAGSIHFATAQQATQWFNSYWQAIQPSVVAAAQAGAEQMAIGTEFQLLEAASPVLWELLIQRVHDDFPGNLTYDTNWSSLSGSIPAWMHDPLLSAIGISAYFPLTQTPHRLAPAALPALWSAAIRTRIDAFARQLGKPVLLSDIGRRNSVAARYEPWTQTPHAPADPPEQAAACNAALQNTMHAAYTMRIYFWAWSYPFYQPKNRPAAHVLFQSYGTCAATPVEGSAEQSEMP